MFFGRNLGTRNVKNRFGPFKVPKCNQKPAKLKQIMSFKWLLRVLKGGRAKMLPSAKNDMNILSLYKHWKKTWHPKLKLFFIANYIPSPVFRGFEQLSRSIWLRVIAWSEMPHRVVFDGAKFWSIFGLWAIIFSPDMLESHSRALKTRISAYFPQKSWAKTMTQWVGVQGQVKVAKKRKNTPTCSGPPTEPQTETENSFFSISSRRLAESENGLDSSLANRVASYSIANLHQNFGRRSS